MILARYFIPNVLHLLEDCTFGNMPIAITHDLMDISYYLQCFDLISHYFENISIQILSSFEENLSAVDPYINTNTDLLLRLHHMITLFLFISSITLYTILLHYEFTYFHALITVQI